MFYTCRSLASGRKSSVIGRRILCGGRASSIFSAILFKSPILYLSKGTSRVFISSSGNLSYLVAKRYLSRVPFFKE